MSLFPRHQHPHEDILPPAPTAKEQGRSILKDIHGDGPQATSIEVTATHISLNQCGARQVFPLSGDMAHYQAVDEEIRAQIARKISMLVPTLTGDQHQQLQAYVFEVLSELAEDQLTRIRAMIAEEIKANPNAPKAMIEALARDAAPEVAAPILAYSPLLGDAELIDILANSPFHEVAEAIARRPTLSETVSKAIVQTDHVHAIVYLLENQGAHFSEETMEILLEKAEDHTGMQAALVQREDLSVNTVNKIARFISRKLLDDLVAQGILPPGAADNLSQAVNARLRSVRIDRERNAEIKATALHQSGRLTPALVTDILESGGESEFIIAALALLAAIPKPNVQRVLDAGSAKAVTALCWKCGLTMRAAIQVQLRLARIHHTRILNARDGTDYPLSNDMLARYFSLASGEI